MHIFGDTLSLGTTIFLLLALGLALSFEFVNGFHDTANAVATVIYTHTLEARTLAVVWSGIWNLHRRAHLHRDGGLRHRGRCLPVELVLQCRVAAPDSRWCSRC